MHACMGSLIVYAVDEYLPVLNACMHVQDNVGSVVKTSEEDDPIAVFTVLNTVGHKEQEWMKQMQNFVAKSCKEESLKKKLAEVRDTSSAVSSNLSIIYGI